MAEILTHGIDVSYAQGSIDWAKAAADPQVDFAIIRATATYPHNGKKGIDLNWERNIREAEAAGLPLGAYHYSYATTVEEAKLEAGHFLNTIQGHKFLYPVALDIEDSCQAKLPDSLLADICLTWLETVQGAGYYAVLYSMASWLKYRLDDPRLAAYDRWVAHVDTRKPMVEGGIWQYSWKGRVEGIPTAVDLNRCYKDYPAIIRAAGLNGWGKQETPPEQGPDYKALYMKAAEKLREIQKIAGEGQG